MFTLGLLQQYDQKSTANNLVGVDVTTRIKRTQVFASVLLDDIQVDRSNASDKEPPSYGVTLGAQGGIARYGWTAFYTQVANLTYRTPNPAETVMRRNVGLGRNFSGYDQLTLRGSVIAGPVRYSSRKSRCCVRARAISGCHIQLSRSTPRRRRC